jgi:hypothetical protein
MPTNGDIDVPPPLPYSLDAADGIFPASAETDAVELDELLFAVDDTALTFTGVSTGKFVVPPEIVVVPPPPPLSPVAGVTPAA